MFNITQALTDAEDLYDYEFFDHPENLILNDDYNEYNEYNNTVKNKYARIIFFDGNNTIVKQMIQNICKRDGTNVYHITHDSQVITGFLHPITEQYFQLSNDF
jgi:hypothetical protein